MMEKVIYTNTEGESIVFSNIPPFILSEKDGFASVDNIITSESGYQQDGESFISHNLDVRNLTIGGTVLGKNKEEYIESRMELIRVFNPKIAGKITYSNDIGNYEIDCIPEFLPKINEQDYQGSHRAKKFTLSLKALDPYWTDKSEIDAEIPMARIEPLFSFPLNITNTFEFAQLIAGDVIEIQNNGHVSVGAVFTIDVNGPLVNPRLYNVITQDYFALKGTFMTGTKLRISTVRGKKKVEQNDGDGWYNIMTKRKVESKFLQIDRGVNYLQLQADSGVEYTTSYIKFEPKILGV